VLSLRLARSHCSTDGIRAWFIYTPWIYSSKHEAAECSNHNTVSSDYQSVLPTDLPMRLGKDVIAIVKLAMWSGEGEQE